ESFDLGDFLKFKASVFRFIDESPYSCLDDIQKNAHEVFDVVIVASAPSMLTDGTEQMFFEKEIVQNGSSYLVKKLSSRSRFLNK
ncbi:hypothetical protein MJM43_31520, partial [Salmonella enterica subsp. enterica serovar Montevideo]|nr:hypothetical protein [Salmonella enterica subsp. enterica serovar Montevideo]